jgi:hypothetical protein
LFYGCGQHAERRLLQLDPTRSLACGDNLALNFDHRLRHEFERFRGDDLRQAATVAQYKERQSAQIAPAMHPTGQAHVCTNVR